jgi:hypothetical protein
MHVKKPGYLTISIDDGHPTDLQAAELLQKFGLKATFYIPARNPEREVMSPQEIRQIANNFEVGSHTLNHKPLKYLSDQEASLEINAGKTWLEDTIGKSVIAFCYPQGKFRLRTVSLVKQAGFLGARTCMFNLYAFPKDPFLFGVSTHGYSHSRTIQLRHALLEKNFRGILNFIAVHKLARDWSEHYRHVINFVERYGGIAHLYFHSWEIAKNNEWLKLNKLFEDVAKNRNLIRITNGEMFKLWHNPQLDTETI